MSKKPVSSRFAGGRFDLLVIAWSLFAVWVVARYGIRLAFLLYAELGQGMDTDIVDRDFANYWVGGRLVLQGNYSLLFHPDAYYAHLQSLFGASYQIHAWSYPPHFLALVSPLGYLEYRPALVVFLSATFAMFVWAAWQFIERYAADSSKGLVALALAGYVFMQIEATQNGFLSGALVLAAFAYMREKAMVAGLCLALLTVKPQLGFLIPLLALLDRNWKLLGWASVFTLALIASSIAYFGTEVWRDYFEQIIPYQKYVMTDWSGIFLRMMPSAFGSLRSLDYTPQSAFMVQAVVSAVAFAAMLRLLTVLLDPLERVFAILAGTFMITPYAFNYDLGAVSVGAACLALRARADDRAVEMWIYAAIAALPAAVAPLGVKGLPISPLILAAGLVALWAGARRPTSIL